MSVHDHSTQAYAEQQETGRLRHYRKAIFDLFAAGKRFTDREIMVALNEPDANNISPEITRLKQDGLLREAGKVRCKWTQKTVRQTEATGAVYFERGAKVKQLEFA